MGNLFVLFTSLFSFARFLFLLFYCFCAILVVFWGGGFPYFVAVFFYAVGIFGDVFEITKAKKTDGPTSFCLSVFGKAFDAWS